MDPFKQQIRQKLTANLIMEKCAHSEALIFRDAWCTQERVIRFTTPYFRALFSVSDGDVGKWKTGDFVMYEALNGIDSFFVRCVLSLSGLDYSRQKIAKRLINACGLQRNPSEKETVLKTWDLTQPDGDPNKLLTDFDALICDSIPAFEHKLSQAMEMANEETAFREGSSEYVTANKYERNPKARAACLAANGTACKVCGIDFGKEYGPEFAGKIEVHHIVPLSQIREEYVVDPVHDLVPVCPNCHMALHSKKDGVYTVEELIALRSRGGMQ